MKPKTTKPTKKVMTIQITPEQFAELVELAQTHYDGLVAPATLAGHCFSHGLEAMSKAWKEGK